ncbi:MULTISPECIES: YbhB/YbcL family Raf kinase inhibitor-like protein [unclassified Streptomyces]|uniref:YbhB/YbcL family Raf kinase inhibitor-like protein n=1 Tax=unclassified Streptomyces TaxID=2593676 RepID=UPI000F44FE22|nr:YbhB/YbcL family Raf kinase inhibitor-like protein [Streptomyces sp. I6]RNL73908.1 YbhB/YbcL family Raf kinase inhibitor-like protein [Streptomyces sp. I6]
MLTLGTLLKNKRAGGTHLAWHQPNLSGPDTLDLRSADFLHGRAIPAVHAGRRAGGRNLSPALAWTGTPQGTAQLLLVVEDPDAPTSRPFVHCLALISPARQELAAGALDADAAAEGVRVLRSGMGRGYLGPQPPKGHGEHRYAFQLFALRTPVISVPGRPDLEASRPRDVLDAVGGPALARGRLDGVYSR